LFVYRNILTAICLLLLVTSGVAQSFFVNGTTRRLNNTDCYQLTSAQNWENGSVWFSDKLDLTKTFDLEFYLNFGNIDAGADGIVFVIQTVGTSALGQGGGSIGFEGFSPALGIEFDDYQNTNINDPAYDHIALVQNGSVAHPTGNSMWKPVSALSSQGNIEDGKDHLVRIKWDPKGFVLEVFFDCVSRLKISNLDIVKTFLNNKSDVWWGFTSATGGMNNNQTVCIEKSVFRKKTFETCVDAAITLTTGKSLNNSYSWSPGTFLSDTKIKTPLCKPDKDITYYVTYKDNCNKDVIDTINVKTLKAPVVTLPSDTVLCPQEPVLIKPEIKNSYSNWQWSNGHISIHQNYTSDGILWFEAYNSCGTSRDSIKIDRNSLPTLNLGNDTAICNGDTLTLKPVLDGDLSTFQWMDNLRNVNRKIYLPGIYWATLQNKCGFKLDSITVNVLSSASVKLGNDTILCPGESVMINAQLNGSFSSAQWNDGSAALNKVFNSAQKAWFTISGQCGTKTDTVNIQYHSPAPLSLGRDTSICNNDSLLLTIDPAIFTIPLWNDGTNSYTKWLTNEGTYKASALNKTCKVEDEITVTLDNSPYFSGINDTTGCLNMPVKYNIDTRNTAVNWSDGDSKFLKSFINNPGKHWVEVNARCGQISDTFTLNFIECVCEFWVPNAFTPGNEDGLNDKLEIKYDCKYTDFNFTIYNRWGEKLWETKDPGEFWDGTYKGKELSVQALFWMAVYTGPKNGVMAKYTQKGTLTIVK
jgi:gliding motility-associated-like protein